MKDMLKNLVHSQQSFVELRYHRRSSNLFVATKGRVDHADRSLIEGVGVRVLVDGCWGFAATADVSEPSIRRAIEKAQKNASSLAQGCNKKPSYAFDRSRLSQDDFVGPGYYELSEMKLEDKLGQVINFERSLAAAGQKVQTAKCRYNEILEEKVIVTSDGAEASLKLAQPEFSLSAIAEQSGERATAYRAAGVSGGWQCLFAHPSLQNAVDETARLATDLLTARYPDGGLKTCILSPSVVGLLCHEAIGHTVEADFVKAGSVASGKIGQQVASSLVSMADSGQELFSGSAYATGNLPFDDEGVLTETTTIIENGILKSYLHNRETAAEYGVAPTGNGRAWLFYDEPLIRMRNTYLLPGETHLDDMIRGLDDGYLVEGAGGGQADANGEFMFGSGWVWRIQGGKKVELLRDATLSGIAFDVLKTVDAVSREFLWDLGSGYCGKGQPAKVDAGGPYIRCKINVGGRQS